MFEGALNERAMRCNPTIPNNKQSYRSYRHVSKAFFGSGGDVASAARARLKVERLAAGRGVDDKEEGGE